MACHTEGMLHPDSTTWTPPPKKRWIAMVWLLTVLFPNSSLFIWFDLLLFRNVLQCQKKNINLKCYCWWKKFGKPPGIHETLRKNGRLSISTGDPGFVTHKGYECRTWFSHSVYGVAPNPAPSMGTNSSFAESCNQNKSCDHKTVFHSIFMHDYFFNINRQYW